MRHVSMIRVPEPASLVRLAVLVVVVGLTPPLAARAQDAAPAPQPAPAAKVLAPVQLQVVISRMRGDKKISSMPYQLSVKLNQPFAARLRLGAQVPIPATPGTDSKSPQLAVVYRDIGTSIDASASAQADGRYLVDVMLSETSVYSPDGSEPGPLRASPAAPVLKSYQANNSMLLRDGQTAQFTAGTDPLTGDLVRVDVTLNVAK